MIIKDVNDKYELKVDKSRKLVYEQLKGLWNEDDFKRFENDYKTKIIPHLGSIKWMKHCDMREYRPTTKVTPEMIGSHLKFIENNGFQGVGVLVDSATTKMQLNRSVKEGVEAPNNYFDNEADLNEWLKAKGY